MGVNSSKGFFDRLSEAEGFGDYWDSAVETADSLTDQGLEAASNISEQVMDGDFSGALDTAVDSAAQAVDTATYQGASQDAVELGTRTKDTVIRNAQYGWKALKETDDQISQYLMAPENADILAATRGNYLPLLANRVWLPLGKEAVQEIQGDIQAIQAHYQSMGESLAFLWGVANSDNLSNALDKVRGTAEGKILTKIEAVETWGKEWIQAGQALLPNKDSENHPFKLAAYSLIKGYFNVDRIKFWNEEGKGFGGAFNRMSGLHMVTGANFEINEWKKRAPEMGEVLRSEKELSETLWNTQMLGSALVYCWEAFSTFLLRGSAQPIRQRLGSKLIEQTLPYLFKASPKLAHAAASREGLMLLDMGLFSLVTGLKMEANAMAHGQDLDWSDPRTWAGIGKSIWSKMCLSALIASDALQKQNGVGQASEEGRVTQLDGGVRNNSKGNNPPKRSTSPVALAIPEATVLSNSSDPNDSALTINGDPNSRLHQQPYRREGSAVHSGGDDGLKDGTLTLQSETKIGEHTFYPGERVSISHGRLFFANTIQDRSFGEFPMKAGLIFFDKQGDVESGILSEDTKVDGVPLKGGKGFERAMLLKGTLAERWQDPQTDRWLVADTHIERDATGNIIDGTYESAIGWNNYQFPPHTRLAQSTKGGLHAVVEDFTIESRNYEGAWVFSFDRNGSLLQAFPVESTDSAGFYDGYLRSLTLGAPVDAIIPGLRKGHKIWLHSNSTIEIEVNGEKIGGIHFPGKAELTVKDGRIIKAKLKQDQIVQGIPCKEGCVLIFNEQAQVVRATKLDTMQTPPGASLEVVDGQAVVQYPNADSILVFPEEEATKEPPPASENGRNLPAILEETKPPKRRRWYWPFWKI